MTWQPLPRIAFAVAIYPFAPETPADLPLELGDELYIIEQGGADGQWFRGYLVAPPSLLAGLTSIKGQTLEARVFSGIFPQSCVEVREVLGDDDGDGDNATRAPSAADGSRKSSDKQSWIDSTILPNRRKSDLPMISPKHKSFARKSIQLADVNLQRPVPPPRDPSRPKPQAPVPMLKVGDETPTSASEPLVDEIGSCLREWHSRNLHELLLSRQYSHLDQLSTVVQRLDASRKQLLHGVLTAQEARILRERTVWDLVNGNKMFTGEVIVRDPAEQGRVMTCQDSAIGITKLQAIMSLLKEAPRPVIHETLTLYHLLLDLKSYAGSCCQPTTLEFFLATKSPGSAGRVLSESYIVDIPMGTMPEDIARNGALQTLYTDLAAGDVGLPPAPDTELYLVVKLQTFQQVSFGTPASRGKTAPREEDNRSDRSKPPSASITSRTGRKSLAWAQKSQRSVKGRLNSLTEPRVTDESPTRPSSGESQDTAKMNPRESSQVSRTVARVTGVGALKLNAIMKQDVEVEEHFAIWRPTTMPVQDSADECPGILRDVLGGNVHTFERSRRGERLQVSMRAFNNPDASNLIQDSQVVFENVEQTCKMGFSGAPTRPRSDIYVTMVEAHLPRQALLSRSQGAPTSLGSSFSVSALQVSVEVRRGSNGELIPDCIMPSSNSDGVSRWESVATERDVPWNQTLRLSLDPEDVLGAHLVVTVADFPNPPFAICHMPLWFQGAFLRDGGHSLLMYRLDDSTSVPLGNAAGRTGYITLPWGRAVDDKSSNDEISNPLLATMRVQTFLCSTRFSQDPVLLGLLKWKQQKPDDLYQLLQRVTFVPEIEIVKRLSDMLDALFGILCQKAGNGDFEDVVFGALVTVLGNVNDRRFNLDPLVDDYIANRFNHSYATTCLIRSFTRLLASPSDPETSRNLRATFKVARHIFRFIAQSRDQQKVKEADIGITDASPDFNKHLRSIFKALDGLMRNTVPVLVGSQTLAVQHFHTWLPVLTGLLSADDIVHLAIDFLDACCLVKGRLVLYKLVLIIRFGELDVFSDLGRRAALCANTARWIEGHWGKTDDEGTEQYREQVRLCCSIINSQLSALGPEVPRHVSKIIDSYLVLRDLPSPTRYQHTLLFPTSIPFPAKQLDSAVQMDEAMVELSAILAAISALPSGLQLSELAMDDLPSLLEDLLQVQMSILQGEAFPDAWLSVHIYHHHNSMRTLQAIGRLLLECFLPDPDEAESYNTGLWRSFFTVLLQLVSSDALALETFSEQKRRAVWKIAGDVREQGAALLRLTWDAVGWEADAEDRQRHGLARLGGYQVQYVPTLVGPIVELCLSVHEGLRRVAVEILQTMIVSEWTLSEDLSVIQTEMIDSLDRRSKTRPRTDSLLHKTFITELLELFPPPAENDDDLLHTALRDLVATMDEFLDLLIAVNSSDGAGEASSMIHRIRLMDFLRDMQKEEMFVRYVHSIARLQVAAGDHAEAGLALQLHADLYVWDSALELAPLSEPDFPAQSHFERKERLYFEIIKHLEDGEAWASALTAYEELQTQYRDNIFDFLKLARTQRAIATIHERIAKSDRVVPKYFKVTYKGMGFPASLRDKEFVFEAGVSERTAVFTDRLQEQHPSAQLVVNGEVDGVEGQYLVIAQLSPHRDMEHPVFQRARVPQVVRDFLTTSRPQFFSMTTKRDTSGHVTEHSAEKVIFKSAERFPTILKRSEIISTERIHIPALQTALERVIRKTLEMVVIERRVLVNDEEGMVPLLIEALNISADPLSDSSVAKYRELVPSASNDNGDEPVLQPLQNALKIALIDHAIMIKRCLAFFSTSLLVPVALQGHVDELAESKFTTLLLVHPTNTDTSRL